MSIISVEEMLGARSGGIDASWKRTYRRAWRVVTDTQWTGALAVRTSIPVSLGNRYQLKDDAGTVYEHDDAAFAMKVDASVDSAAEDDRTWTVTVDYGPFDPTQFPENPIDQPLKISWGSNRFERTCDETAPDSDGATEAIVNSAGDYFDPPIAMDDSRPTLKIVRNEPTYDPHYAYLWKDTLNQDAWNGFDPATVKMVTPLGELQYNPLCGFYYTITYEFEINEDGWVRKVLDQGLRILDDTGDDQEQALDQKGQAVTSPVLLDGNGAKLASGDDPFYLEFKIYKEADYSVLGLDFIGMPGQGS